METREPPTILDCKLLIFLPSERYPNLVFSFSFHLFWINKNCINRKVNTKHHIYKSQRRTAGLPPAWKIRRANHTCSAIILPSAQDNTNNSATVFANFPGFRWVSAHCNASVELDFIKIFCSSPPPYRTACFHEDSPNPARNFFPLLIILPFPKTVKNQLLIFHGDKQSKKKWQS